MPFSPGRQSSLVVTEHGPLALHVLLVDDEFVNRSVAGRMLKRLGCTSVDMSDGDEALEALLLLHADGRPTDQPPMQCDAAQGSPERTFDVALVDIQMKRMNGDELCRRLRAAGITIPLIAATGT